MDKSYQSQVINLLMAMDVNTNVHAFSQEWIASNRLESMDDVFTLLDRLGIAYTVHPYTKKLASKSHLAALYITDDDIKVCRFLLNDFQTYQQDEFESDSLPRYAISSLVVLIHEQPRERNSTDWVGERIDKFKSLLPMLLCISFFANVFALAIPFITMSIYDHVIGGDAGHELVGIAIGAALLFTMMLLLKVIRSQLLTTISNRISREISEKVLYRIFSSSLLVNRSVSSSALMSRLTTAESFKGLLQGPLGGALFDLPFVFLFIIAIGFLGGWLVLVPVFSLFCYYGLAHHSQKKLMRSSHQTTISGTNRYSLLFELNSKLAFLRSANMSEFWIKRFEKANVLAAKNSFFHSSHQAKYTSIYYALGLLSTLAVIALGIGLIFNQAMTAGGLIATMMLISRVTGPAQMLANSGSRFTQIKQARLQINQSISQKIEGDFSFQHHSLSSEKPTIELEQITLRFPQQMKPALSGISLKIEPGQVVVITGPMASGKTALLELLAGLNQPQSGVIKVNGHNLSQYDPQIYRQWLGYYSAKPELLLLTIREFVSDNRNLTDDLIIDAIEQVGGKAWFDTLSCGLDTQLNESIVASISHALSGYEAKVLSQAKLYLHEYPFYLLDNPVMDTASRDLFQLWISQRKGRSTIVFSSHDPELIKLADQVIILDSGSLVYAGPLPDNSNTEIATEASL